MASQLPFSWAEMVALLNGFTHFGMAGVRDPDHPCTVFDPTPDGLVGYGGGHCMGDGHYLCHECEELSVESDFWPEDECQSCHNHHSAVELCKKCNGLGYIKKPTRFERKT